MIRMRRVACSITARTYAWVPSSRSTVKKSQARMVSAWERRNCDPVGPVRRRPGSMPLALRISHTVDAATLTPRPASSPWILRYPQRGFSRASRWTSARMLRRVAGRPVLPHADRAAQRRRTMSRCQRRIVSGGNQQPQPLAPCFGYHAEQEGREQSPVRPGQVRAAWLPPLQDGELMTQDQDFRGLPGLLTPRQPQPGGRPRGQEKDEPQAHDW
jgi:hypothetical protein